MGNVVNWGFVTGKKNSGKSTIAKKLAKLTSGFSIDMNIIQEQVLKKMKKAAGEDADSIEEVPIKKVE
jgi:adenylate kinase family enzyme